MVGLRCFYRDGRLGVLEIRDAAGGVLFGLLTVHFIEDGVYCATFRLKYLFRFWFCGWSQLPSLHVQRRAGSNDEARIKMPSKNQAPCFRVKARFPTRCLRKVGFRGRKKFRQVAVPRVETSRRADTRF